VTDDSINIISSVALLSGDSTITTVAGDGTEKYKGDGVPAISTSLFDPLGVAADTSGNIYIADTQNFRIRMVTKSTGTITTVAGDGTRRYKGDGGLATSTGLGFPTGVAVDASGNIYIADEGTDRILMVTKSTGIITTVAGDGTFSYSGDGGLATSARLRSPHGVAVDALGNIYIADTLNYRVRMVTKSTGIITTVAGDGAREYKGDGGLATSAGLYDPNSVAVDASGNVYIADTENNRVRMVTKSTGIITTVAGDGAREYKGDGGLATSAGLYNPHGVAVDASGNIYIADTENNRVRMVTKSTGIITTVAGEGTREYKGDGGPAKSSGLDNPWGVAVDASGNIYIADSMNNRIRLINPKVLAPTTPPNTSPTPSPTRRPTHSPTSAVPYTNYPNINTPYPTIINTPAPTSAAPMIVITADCIPSFFTRNYYVYGIKYEKCVKCAPGSYTSGVSSVCFTCPVGSMVNAEQTGCVGIGPTAKPTPSPDDEVPVLPFPIDCRPSTYVAIYFVDGSQGQLCDKCPLGSYSSAASTVCSTCPAGYKVNAEQTGCSLPGSPTPSPTTPPPSTFKTPSPTIIDTPAPTYEVITADCIPSFFTRFYFEDGKWYQKCVKCAPGSYTSGVSGVCFTCPVGSMVNAEQTGCVGIGPTAKPTPSPNNEVPVLPFPIDCRPSTYVSIYFYNGSQGQFCDICPLGSYSSAASTVCSTCPAGFKVNTERTGCSFPGPPTLSPTSAAPTSALSQRPLLRTLSSS
jgi:sugar lactone lactonase YvrE